MPTPAATEAAPRWTLRLPRDRTLALAGGAPKVMGVLNLTPDSFSDGGRWTDPDRAVEHGLALLAEGADLLDLGAESTRPGGGVYGAGAAPVSADEEWRRLGPVLAALRQRTDAPLSVDTRKGEVARRALDAGADLVNDVGAVAAPDPALLAAVAGAGCPLVLMHSRGELATMQRRLDYEDLLGEVCAELATAVERAAAAGVERRQLVLDPGIGFAKSAAGNLALLRRLDAFAGLGRPLLVGASRKSFIGHLTGAPPAERVAGSLAAAAWAAAGGAALVRVHDVAPTVQFLKVWTAVADAQPLAAGTPDPDAAAADDTLDLRSGAGR